MTGAWALQIKTPIGTIPVTLTLTDSGGTAESNDETVPLQDFAADGGHLTWRQAVTRPMRLTLNFDVLIDGDTMTGHARAGRLPRSTVTGTRLPS